MQSSRVTLGNALELSRADALAAVGSLQSSRSLTPSLGGRRAYVSGGEPEAAGRASPRVFGGRGRFESARAGTGGLVAETDRVEQLLEDCTLGEPGRFEVAVDGEDPLANAIERGG